MSFYVGIFRCKMLILHTDLFQSFFSIHLFLAKGICACFAHYLDTYFFTYSFRSFLLVAG
jgi:hypothetical protein